MDSNDQNTKSESSKTSLSESNSETMAESSPEHHSGQESQNSSPSPKSQVKTEVDETDVHESSGADQSSAAEQSSPAESTQSESDASNNSGNDTDTSTNKDIFDDTPPVASSSDEISPPEPPFFEAEGDPEEIENLFGGFGSAQSIDHGSSPGSDAEPTEEANALLSYTENLSKRVAVERDETPKGLAPGIELHEHQKIALHWLKNREANPLLRGGILADEMGLGKTIEMIALMISRPFQKPPETPFVFQRLDQLGPEAARPSNDVKCNGCTLIVAPASLLRQWRSEIENKTSPKLFAWIFEKQRSFTPASFHRNPIVLVSYETLSKDFDCFEKGKKTLFFDKATFFYRIILDEAHKIKNRMTKNSRACRELNAEYRWYVSGTPIQNSIEELYPALNFLRVNQFDQWDIFDQRVMKVHLASAVATLHSVLGSYLLRRTKTSVVDEKLILTLPEKVQTFEYTNFDEAQQDAYDSLEKETQRHFTKYKRDANHDHLFKKSMLLRLRQTCLHPWLVNFTLGDGLNKYFLSEQRLVRNAAYNFTAEQVNRILDLLKAAKDTGEDIKCEKCGDKDAVRFIPGCGHGLCCHCFTDISPTLNKLLEIDPLQASCPICQTQYERLFITTLIAFKCAWWPGFRRDSWDEDYLDDSPVFSPDSCIKPLITELHSGIEGRTRESRSIDARIWGSDNVDCIEGFLEHSDLSLLCADTDISAQYQATSGFKRGSSAMSDGSSGETDTSYNGELSKRHCNPEDVQAMRESSVSQEEELFVPQDKPDSELQDAAHMPSAFVNSGSGPSNGKAPIIDLSATEIKATAPLVIPDFQLRVKDGKFNLPLNHHRLKKDAAKGDEEKRRYLSRLLEDHLPDCTKISALVSLLNRKHTEFPDDRIIIFSEFTTMLDFIEAAFSQLGKNNHVRYDGSLSAEEKDAIVKKFMDTTNEIRILLCSLKSGNVGLNLTSANHVIFMEPYWNPYVEDQAIDRCHRIGQTKQVHVTRIVVPNTLEARILKVQNEKRELVGQVIDDEAAIKEKGKLLKDDLDYILGIKKSPQSSNHTQADISSQPSSTATQASE